MTPEKQIADLKQMVDDLNLEVALLTRRLLASEQTNGSSFFMPDDNKETAQYDYEYAKISHQYYQRDPKRLKIFDQASQLETTLKGFYLDYKKMDLFNSAGTKVPKVEKYFLMLGRKPKSEQEPNKFTSYFTFLVLGIDGDDQVIMNNGDPVIYEYLTPCPDTCSNIDIFFPKRCC